MTTKTLFSDAKDGICDYCVDKLYELWIKHGKPEGEGGITTETYVSPETLASDLGYDGPDNDIASFNSIIEKLFEIVDCRHIGSGIWYTDYEKSTEYAAFCDEGYDLVKDYVQDNLLEDFCDNHDQNIHVT